MIIGLKVYKSAIRNNGYILTESPSEKIKKQGKTKKFFSQNRFIIGIISAKISIMALLILLAGSHALLNESGVIYGFLNHITTSANTYETDGPISPIYALTAYPFYPDYFDIVNVYEAHFTP